MNNTTDLVRALEELQIHREAHLRIDNIVMGAGVFELAEHGDVDAAWNNTIAAVRKLATPQPAIPEGMNYDSPVPDDYRNQACAYRAGWNNCRSTSMFARDMEAILAAVQPSSK